MALQTFKPTSPGRRSMVRVSTAGLHKGGPLDSLTEKKPKTGGRNNNGRITTRHIGGGHKQAYRIIDFKRDKEGIAARVERLEDDPNRTAHIALLCYADGERRYIIAPKGLAQGDQVVAGKDAPIKVGNTLPLRNMPVGSTVHCIEMKPGKGAQLARAAGAGAQLISRDGAYATLRLRSGEMRKVHVACRATIGEVGNSEHSLRSLGKAGAKVLLDPQAAASAIGAALDESGAKLVEGSDPVALPKARKNEAELAGARRAHIRDGAAMNPVDHPHGGGEAKAGQGNPHPVSPWGTPAKGYKTRHNKRTQKFIVRDRRS